MTEDLSIDYIEWYNNSNVLFCMRPYTYRREVAFLSKTEGYPTLRPIRCSNTQDLRYQIDSHIKYRDHEYNIYTSVAKYSSIDRDLIWFPNKVLRDNWRQNYWKFMIDYDFFIDIDLQSHNDFDIGKMEVIKIQNFLISNKVPHELRFSGMGFHIVILNETPDKNFKLFDENNIYTEYCNLAKKLIKLLDLKFLDLKIYDARRLIKCPYTLACYGKTKYVCKPIHSTEELIANRLEDYMIESCKNQLTIKPQIFCKDGHYDNLKRVLG